MLSIDRFTNVQRTGSDNNWTAKCPAHDDGHNSLSVSHRDGRWLLYCHAGCSIDAIVATLGIKQSELFDSDTRKSKSNGKAKFVAEYIYRTADGQLSRKVCRTADKQFPQFRWADSKWQSGTEGVAVLPYRLPELVKAEVETPVFICEGEKDCDRLASLGFTATTNPMGAGKWRAGLNKWFADRPVFVVPDNDEPGRKHAADIVRHVKPVAARIRIVELPGLTKKGGDVSDWLDADPKNRDRLLDVAMAPPETLKVDGAALLDDVEAFLGRFVVYPSLHARVAHTIWIAHTHVMDAWESTPRIAFLSPEPASGKTRALEVSVLLVPNPVEAINVTPAYLFRKVASDEGLPTILYDEIDTVFGPKAKENEEIRALLNAGHRRGAVAGRCVVRGKTVETEEIPAYCAVALAGLGWLPETIMSRSIIVPMRRRAPKERVQPFRRRVSVKEGARLRDRLAVWGASAFDHLRNNWPDLPSGVADREADVWEPIIALADFAGGKWPDRARTAAIEMIKAGEDREPSLGIRLLADLRTIFADREAMTTNEILVDLVAIKEAPWGDLKGKPLNDRGLGRRLRQYGIKSKQIRFGEKGLKGYLRADLLEAWESYLPASSPESETSETSETSPEKPTENVSPVSDSLSNVSDQVSSVSDHVSAEPLENPNEIKDVSDVSDVSLVAGDRGEDETWPKVCEHCGNPEHAGKPIEMFVLDGTEYRMHPACRTEWLANPDADDWSFNLGDETRRPTNGGEPKPRTYNWPTREEWANRRQHPYWDGETGCPFADRYSHNLSAYGSTEEITAAIKALEELWQQYGGQLRELHRKGSPLYQQPGETEEEHVRRSLTMSDADREIASEPGELKFKRHFIRKIIAALRDDSLPPFSETGHAGSEAKELTAPFVQRYEAAEKAAEEQWEQEMLLTPVDDAAWEKELHRRKQIEAEEADDDDPSCMTQTNAGKDHDDHMAYAIVQRGAD